MSDTLLKQRARHLRKNMSEAEKLLWKHLRNRQPEGMKFRRNHPVRPYIVDFVCLEKKLVIEVDGGQHTETVEYDKKRTEYLTRKGYRVIGF